MADAPTTIADRYVVERLLGAGASARTWLCHDPVDDRTVAVKELHYEHLEDWRHVDLFEREAKVLARLDHVGVPNVYGYFGRDDGGELYIVQEFVDGQSLADRLEDGPMFGQDEIVALAHQLLDILDYLHGRAPPVLHRDIKPSNILIRPDGSPVLVDFGGVTFGWRPPSHGGTTVVGTFGYMPPEQLVGQGGATADLYALGATLLHVLTTRPPTDFSFESGRIEIPPELPAKDPLTRLIEALLRPAPRDRPQSAMEARELLGGGALAVSATTSSAPMTYSRPGARAVPITRSGPNFIDLGDPPRDRQGEFRDVYRNLINPIFPAKILWSRVTHIGNTVGWGFVSLFTFGIFPLSYASLLAGRVRRYRPLFTHGTFTRGSIRSVNKGSVYATFRFEFEADRAVYSAVIDYAYQMASYWQEGDTVPVLYDPNDPTSACFVYR